MTGIRRVLECLRQQVSEGKRKEKTGGNAGKPCAPAVQNAAVQRIRCDNRDDSREKAGRDNGKKQHVLTVTVLTVSEPSTGRGRDPSEAQSGPQIRRQFPALQQTPSRSHTASATGAPFPSALSVRPRFHTPFRERYGHSGLLISARPSETA